MIWDTDKSFQWNRCHCEQLGIPGAAAAANFRMLGGRVQASASAGIGCGAGHCIRGHGTATKVAMAAREV